MKRAGPKDELVLLFGAEQLAAPKALVALLEALPRLCGEEFAYCELGMRAATGLLACLVRFKATPSAKVEARLDFWTWRLGGSISCPHPGGPSTKTCGLGPQVDAAPRCVTAAEIGVAARALLALLSVVPTDTEGGTLHLHLQVDAGGGDGLGFWSDELSLFVPSPVALPIGDDVAIQIHRGTEPPIDLGGRVTALWCAGERGPGCPAGLVVQLASPSPEAVGWLEAQARSATDPARRSAPRYAACLPATVVPRQNGSAPFVAWGAQARPSSSARPGPLEHVECLSQGGAFVRTASRLPPGTPVHLSVTLPDGAPLVAAGVVRHTTSRGLGISFDVDGSGEARIAEALVQVAARKPRALIVHGDVLSRRRIGDALAERGFEVYAARGVSSGMEVLTDQLLDLDLLVTAHRLPDGDGEALVRLVRGAGGEQDLAILVVVDEVVDVGVKKRLLLAGADAVVAKPRGSAAIQEAATRAFLRRSRRAATIAGGSPSSASDVLELDGPGWPGGPTSADSQPGVTP